MKVDGTSLHEKRLTENELKISVLYSKFLNGEDRSTPLRPEND